MEVSSVVLLREQEPLMYVSLAADLDSGLGGQGSGIGGCRFSHAPPLAPFSSVNKPYAFTVANGRGPPSRGGLLKTESWAPG